MTRIIAGSSGGRRLKVPTGEHVRPTSDRVREAVFAAVISWGGDEASELPLAGLSFLDCYAGSGAVALEAASRGAGKVCAIEADRSTIAVIKENARSTGLSVEVLQGKVEQLLATPAVAPFDVIWFDPPYAVSTESVAAQIQACVRHGWLADDGMVIVERSVRTAPLDLSLCFTTSWQRKYGDTTVYFGMGGATCP